MALLLWLGYRVFRGTKKTTTTVVFFVYYFEEDLVSLAKSFAARDLMRDALFFLI